MSDTPTTEQLMHWALDTHGREGDAHPLLSNFAHVYIINDMLREELDRDPPLDGLDVAGARKKSLEQLVAVPTLGKRRTAAGTAQSLVPAYW